MTKKIKVELPKTKLTIDDIVHDLDLEELKILKRQIDRAIRIHEDVDNSMDIIMEKLESIEKNQLILLPQPYPINIDSSSWQPLPIWCDISSASPVNNIPSLNG